MRRGSGGAIRAFISLLLETLIGGLIAPIAMLIQTEGVLGILAGRDSGWNAQRRDGDAVPLRLIWRQYWRFMASGIVLALIAYAVSPALFLWMSPVLIGLVLAVPLVVMTGSSGIGIALQRIGLLRIVEEARPSPVMSRAAALRATEAPTSPGAIKHLLSDPALLAAHRAMLPPPRRPRRDPIDVPLLVGLAKLAEAETLQAGIDQLSTQETAAVLASAVGLDRLLALADAHAEWATSDG
jgi:membrane glycosyltransferase